MRRVGSTCIAIGILLGGCEKPTAQQTSALAPGVVEAFVYVCPTYAEDINAEASGYLCEVEQQFDSDGNPLSLFNYYPAVTPAADGYIAISSSYSVMNTPTDPATLSQCCHTPAVITGAPQLLAFPAAGKVCSKAEWRKASGNAASRVDGVKQWELDASKFRNINKCNGTAGNYLALTPAKTYTVQKNSTATKVAATTKKMGLLGLINTGGLAGRKYELWLASRADKDYTAIAFGLADEETPLANDFCVQYNDGGPKESIQTKATAGRGHPTIAAFLNALADAATQALGGFWACDGGEGSSPAANKTQIDNCSGRWPPTAATVVDDAKGQMNTVTTDATFWDASKWFDGTPGNVCP